jgi:subtilisin family serine protease
VGLGWQWGIFKHSESIQPRADHIDTAKIPAAQRLQADAQPDLAMLESGLVSLREGKGVVRRYRLALNEIYEMTQGREGVRIIPAQADARALAAYASAEAMRGKVWPALVLYPENGPVEKATRRVLTGRMLVELKEASSKTPDLSAAGLEIVERPSYSTKHLITQSRSGSPLEALAAIEKLRSDPTIESVTPLLKRHYQAAAIPNDPYFADQWHLNNTGQGKGTPGIDAQVKDVWDGLQGEGVRITIVDDGLEINHPDLAANVDTQPNHWDWTEQDQDPSPNLELGDFHGTVVGGTAAARGNNGIGVSGVAPRATLVGFRFLQGNRAISDDEIADLVMRGNDVIQVKNNSWAPSGGAATLGASSDLFTLAMNNAAKTGRGGLGVLSVFASGNERDIGVQGNKNEYANNIHAIAVGALGNTGRLAAYSETGSHLTVVAPSGGGTLGLVSTDLTGISGYNPHPTQPDYQGEGYN